MSTKLADRLRAYYEVSKKFDREFINSLVKRHFIENKFDTEFSVMFVGNSNHITRGYPNPDSYIMPKIWLSDFIQWAKDNGFIYYTKDSVLNDNGKIVYISLF